MSYWHYYKCPSCKSMALVNENFDETQPCPKCAKLPIRNRRAAQFNCQTQETLYIVHDPLPYDKGGFKEGALITRLQAEYMCQYKTLSEGTILRNTDNTRYKVVVNNGKMKISPLNH